MYSLATLTNLFITSPSGLLLSGILIALGLIYLASQARLESYPELYGLIGITTLIALVSILGIFIWPPGGIIAILAEQPILQNTRPDIPPGALEGWFVFVGCLVTLMGWISVSAFQRRTVPAKMPVVNRWIWAISALLILGLRRSLWAWLQGLPLFLALALYLCWDGLLGVLFVQGIASITGKYPLSPSGLRTIGTVLLVVGWVMISLPALTLL